LVLRWTQRYRIDKTDAEDKSPKEVILDFKIWAKLQKTPWISRAFCRYGSKKLTEITSA
jgi:hypothetical protein